MRVVERWKLIRVYFRLGTMYYGYQYHHTPNPRAIFTTFHPTLEGGGLQQSSGWEVCLEVRTWIAAKWGVFLICTCFQIAEVRLVLEGLPDMYRELVKAGRTVVAREGDR